MNLFRKHDCNLYSPIDGKCIDILEVSDNVLNIKIIGDGIAVIPEGNTVCSPADGEIVMIAPTKHAFGISLNSGVELLIHVGIDTVNLKGKGFECLAQVGQKVRYGLPVIRFDTEMMKGLGYDMSVMVIVTSGWKDYYIKNSIGKQVKTKDTIITIGETS